MTTTDETLRIVVDVVAETFGAPPGQIGPLTDAADVQGWDSLAHTRLIMSIERRLGIRLPARRAFLAANVGALSELADEMRAS